MPSRSVTPPAPRSKDLALPSQRHRPDIQGLRALAVLIVVLSHAGVTGFDGGYVGVDVFFVLSGYLITGILLADGIKNGAVSLRKFYIRRAQRILPSATLVLIVTAIASYLILNVVRAKEAIYDAVYSGFFAANIRFADVGTDYFSQNVPPSPFRHYWSLAVEEQFYIVWPTLLALALFGASRNALTQRWRSDARLRMGLLLALVAVVFLLSLAWSIHQTSNQPQSAYFSTLTRAWELALGAALAIGTVTLSRISPWVRSMMGWGGVFAIAAATVLFSETTVFPGAAALVPTVGAALLIIAEISPTPSPAGPRILLSLRPMRFIGDISYTLYLWHWPILVLAAAHHGEPLSVTTNLVLMAGAIALSAVTYRLYENPLRRLTGPRAHRAALASWLAAPVLVMVVAGSLNSRAESEILRDKLATAEAQAGATSDRAQVEAEEAASAEIEPEAAERAQALGIVKRAVARSQAGQVIPRGLSPPVTNLKDSIYTLPAGCMAEAGPSTTSEICSMGATGNSQSMVVLGDSHAQMWTGNFDIAASELGYTLRPLIKSGCSPATWAGAVRKDYERACLSWLAWALENVRKLQPDVAVVVGSYGGDIAIDRGDQAVRGIERAVKAISSAADTTVVLGDVPGVERFPVDCLLQSGAVLGTCTFPMSTEFIAMREAVGGVARSLDAPFIDTSGWFCSAGSCPTVVGMTVAYVDLAHVTEAYAQVVSPAFTTSLQRAIAAE